jgi:histone acetyltransferase MYST1
MDDWVSENDIVLLPSEAIEARRSGEVLDSEEASSSSSSVSSPSPSKQKRKFEGVSTIQDDDHDEHEGLDESSLREHEEVTKVKNIKRVQLGKYIMYTWYFSPFPKEYYPNGIADMLYFDEFSFRFFRHKSELLYFQQNHPLPRHPPGDEIYRKDDLSMFEIDGQKEKIYCQNLSYFAKLFLDHKTLYYDVDPFMWYVLCERDERGFHPVGYFSKEKLSETGYNLACILIFPAHQRKGYGRFLIAFSYELSKSEGKVGSPEKPLSDLGAVSYRSYWASVIIDYLRSLDESRSSSVLEICEATAINQEDVIATLYFLNILRYVEGSFVLCATNEILDRLAERYPLKGPFVDRSCLHWAPYLTEQTKEDRFRIEAKKKMRPEGGTLV